MARGVEPKCRYGHGPLVQEVPPRQPNEDEESSNNYFVPSINQYTVNMGLGYTFEIWECPTCSYIELHDYDPDKAT